MKLLAKFSGLQWDMHREKDGTWTVIPKICLTCAYAPI